MLVIVCEDLLMNFVAEDLQALSVVESPSFRLFTEMLNPSFNMPSRKTLSNKLIPKKKAAMQSCIKSNLENIEQVCVTLDIWTNRDMRSYIGMTCHYIESFQLKSAMLACKHFRVGHAAELISEKYDEILTSFELCGKVEMIVTDNASNMKKAFLVLPGLQMISGNSESVDEEDTP